MHAPRFTRPPRMGMSSLQPVGAKGAQNGSRKSSLHATAQHAVPVHAGQPVGLERIHAVSLAGLVKREGLHDLPVMAELGKNRLTAAGDERARRVAVVAARQGASLGAWRASYRPAPAPACAPPLRSWRPASCCSRPPTRRSDSACAAGCACPPPPNRPRHLQSGARMNRRRRRHCCRHLRNLHIPSPSPHWQGGHILS